MRNRGASLYRIWRVKQRMMLYVRAPGTRSINKKSGVNATWQLPFDTASIGLRDHQHGYHNRGIGATHLNCPDGIVSDNHAGGSGVLSILDLGDKSAGTTINYGDFSRERSGISQCRASIGRGCSG